MKSQNGNNGRGGCEQKKLKAKVQLSCEFGSFKQIVDY